MAPTLRITSDQAGQRLDVLLSRTYPDFSRAYLQKVIKKGGVTVNGKVQKTSYPVNAGEVIGVPDAIVKPVAVTQGKGTSKRSDLPLEILFEDEHLLVLNKPAGLVVHPAPGHPGDTLVDWLAQYLGPQGVQLFSDATRLGLVHRLDKDTSGVILSAKTVPAQTALGRQFHDRLVEKTYVAFVEGVPSSKEGMISAPVGRSRKDPTRMAVSTIGRPSETRFHVEKDWKEVALVRLQPKTGRTHQIRVHMAALGHPIVGDTVYGSQNRWAEEFAIARPLLHAEKLVITHPVTSKRLTFKAPWPKDFKAAEKALRKAFAVFLVMVGLLSAAQLQAEDNKSTSKKMPSKTSTSSSYRKLKAEFDDLRDDVGSIRKQLAELQKSFEDAGVTGRLRDLEKAVSELNTRSVSDRAGAEESKSQVLDASRKVKGLQETVDQLRDQVDRLQQSVIRQKAREDNASPASAVSTKP